MALNTPPIRSKTPLFGACRLPLVALTSAFLSACASGHEALLDVPVDMREGTSSIVIHRPLAAGTRLHVQGVYRKHHRITAKSSGFVVHQEVDNLQLAYDLTKTFTEVDLDGNPKRVRYDVGVVRSNQDELPPLVALGAGQVVHLQGPDAAHSTSSGGQQFDIERREGKIKVAMRSGQLNALERAALTDPFGPGYELWFEGELARMFGPQQPKRMGDEWDIDLDRARHLLEYVGDLVGVTKISGRASFVGLDKVGDIPVQKIEAWIKGEGKLRHEVTYKVRANNNAVELQYSGVFPVDLALPPVEHQWSLKGKAQLVAEINDDLGDIEFETRAEHQSRTLEVRH